MMHPLFRYRTMGFSFFIEYGVSEGKTAANGCKNRRYNTLIFS